MHTARWSSTKDTGKVIRNQQKTDYTPQQCPRKHFQGKNKEVGRLEILKFGPILVKGLSRKSHSRAGCLLPRPSFKMESRQVGVGNLFVTKQGKKEIAGPPRTRRPSSKSPGSNVLSHGKNDSKEANDKNKQRVQRPVTLSFQCTLSSQTHTFLLPRRWPPWGLLQATPTRRGAAGSRCGCLQGDRDSNTQAQPAYGCHPVPSWLFQES